MSDKSNSSTSPPLSTCTLLITYQAHTVNLFHPRPRPRPRKRRAILRIRPARRRFLRYAPPMPLSLYAIRGILPTHPPPLRCFNAPCAYAQPKRRPCQPKPMLRLSRPLIMGVATLIAPMCCQTLIFPQPRILVMLSTAYHLQPTACPQWPNMPQNKPMG